MKHQKKYEQAKDFLLQSIGYAQQVNDPGEESSSLLQLADLYRLTINYNQVLPLALKALELARNIKSRKLEGDVYEFLADYYQQTGNTKLSYSSFRKHKEIEGEMVNASRINQLLDLEMQMLSKRKADEIAQLNRQKNVQELLIDKQQLVLRQRNLLLMVAAAILLLTLVSVFFIIREIRLRQKRRTQSQLLQLRENQLREVLEAELGERKRIGEELHDSLGQSLSLIKLNVSALTDTKPANNLPDPMVANLLKLVDGAFTELRTISHNMAPIMLKEKGLTEAVRDLTNRLIESSRLNIDFGITGTQPPLPPLTEHSLYRVVQEILNNIIHHSQASSVCFQMIFDQNELTIMAEDNGCGFNPENPDNHKGMGLNNIRKRVANLQGHVDIDSVIGRGTTITITLPL
ncbi:MAG: sensor histidine kinase [Bacteroidales bacterium]|nr:sensor histidine kinase [Bacteroidales bacterium]